MVLGRVEDGLEGVVQEVGVVSGPPRVQPTAAAARPFWWRNPARLDDAWDALHRNFSHPLPEAGQADVDFPDLRLLLLDQLLQDLFLLPDDRAELGVDDFRVELAAHQSGALVVLDVTLVDGLGQFDVLAEALLLEVPDGELVGEREEVKDPVSDVIILKKRITKMLIGGVSTLP